MIEQYRPEHYREVAAFARKLDNFFYVKLIIRAHTTQRMPGACFVWREDGRVAAFAAAALLNEADAWLWGMRVDPAFQNRGVASRFTLAQLRFVRDSGRRWAGLNTRERRGKAPTFRVMEKLGFRLEETCGTDIFWRRPKSVARPRLARHPDAYRVARREGAKTAFISRNGWFYTRLLPARREWFNASGFVLDGVPLRLTRHIQQERGRPHRVVAVGLFCPPADFRSFVPRLLALAPRRGHLVVNYPVAWRREFRRAALESVPRMRHDRGCWLSAWRVYGKPVRGPRAGR